MLNVLLWLLAVEAMGLAVFPLCYFLFPRLRDRGFSVSKPLGILLIGYLSWILSVLHVLPSVQLTVAGLLIAVGGLSLWYAWGRRLEILAFARRELVVILAAEVVFLVMFFGWVAYRAIDPAISGTEQPMDFAFLNASIRSDVGAPEDPWFRGASISYYYFGYWMMGALSKLTGIASSVSYNLSLALIPALGAMGVFGLVFDMVRSEGRLRYALAGGIAAALLLVVVANLEGVLEFMRANGLGSGGFWDWVRIDGLDGAPSRLAESWRPEEWLWWWRATRVIGDFGGGQVLDYTIQEFPFFSFILGDLHPHVMSVPFVVLFLTLCWSLLKAPAHVWRAFDIRSYAALVAMALSLGGLGFTNMWDLPVFSAVVLGVFALKTFSVRGAIDWRTAGQTLLNGGAVIALALLLILPYLVTFTGQVSGIAPVASATTRPFHMLVVWTLFFVAVTPFILAAFWQTTVRHGWARLTNVSLLVGFSPYVVWAFLHLERGGTSSELPGRLFHILPFAMLISIAVYCALWTAREDRSSPGKAFALALSALGLLLIMGPELLLVDDSFGGAFDRMNTVFKLYYQGWIVLAVASGFALYYWWSLRERTAGWKLLLTHLWSAVFVVLLAGAAYYPLATAATNLALAPERPTLDGLAYINRFAGAEYRAIEFIREAAGPDSAVLEAVGDDYTDFGRISSSTGVPTVMGWLGHEIQWRGATLPLEARSRDVETIYRTQDVEEARILLAKYSVDFVYVGSRERQRYGAEGLGKFATFMETAFSDGDVLVYRMIP
jgi:YYY domain-containing protein